MIIQSKSDYELLCSRLQQADYIVVDVETTGLNVRKDRVIGVGLGLSANEAYYIPLASYNTAAAILTTQSSDIGTVLALLATKKLICHNAAYDLRIIRNNLKVDLVDALYCDTLLLKHTCDEIPPFGLKEISKKLFGDEVTDEQIDLKKSIKANGGEITKKNYELYKADMPVIAKYCEQDCKLTYRLFEYYSKQLETDGLQSFFYNEEVMPLYKFVTIPMQDHGVKLDIELMKQTLVEITKDINNLEDEVQAKLAELCPNFKDYFLDKYYEAKASGNFLQTLCKLENVELPLTATGRLAINKKTFPLIKSEVVKQFIASGSIDSAIKERVQMEMHSRGVAGRYFINLGSKDDLRRIIYDYLGENPLSYTDKGAWRVNEELLESLDGKYDFITPLIAYNKLNKIKATYIERFLEEAEDSIFYPSFQQHRTISGRYGSDLQQLPRAMESGDPIVMKYTNLCRKFFIARDGHIFVDTDYESLEPHVFASVSGDRGLHDIFNNNKDFYSTIAIMTEGLQGVSADKNAENYLGRVNKAARQKSKSYSLGVPYGLGAYKLHKELNIDQREAEILIKNYMTAFPDLHNWMKTTDSRVVKDCKIKTLAGRIRRMPKAGEYYQLHGDAIFDDLELWKKYHEIPALYAEAKQHRKEFKNYINNGRNFQIQSLAASIVNRACIAINRRLKIAGIKGLVIAQIHDQAIVEVQEDQKFLAATIIQQCLENVIKLDVALKAPPAFGYNFAESH